MGKCTLTLPPAYQLSFPRPSGLYARLLFSSTLERSEVIISRTKWLGPTYSGIWVPLENLGPRYLFCQWEEIVFSHGNHSQWDVENHKPGRCVAQHEVRETLASGGGQIFFWGYQEAKLSHQIQTPYLLKNLKMPNLSQGFHLPYYTF